MVEYNVIALLEQIGFVKGTDLFLANLPQGTSEGVAVKTSGEISDDGALDVVTLSVVVVYNDNSMALENARAIKNKLKADVGRLGSSSATMLPITLTGYGTDELGRQIYAVTAQVAY